MKYILIVDDALDLGRVLQTMLMTLDPALIIKVVPSAEEAMLETGKHPVDLLVTDLRLPGMTGLDLIRKIRARQPELQAIVITGVTDERLVQQAKAIVPAALLRKPLDFALFLEKSRAILGYPPVPIRQESFSSSPQPSPQPVQPLAGSAPRPLFELINALRQSLAAQSVLILDEHGRVVIKDGDSLPSEINPDYPAALFATFSAAGRLSGQVSAAPLQHIQVFSGPVYHLLAAPVNVFALLVILKKGRSALRLALAVEEILAVQPDLAAALAAVAPALPEKPAASPPPESKPAPPQNTVPLASLAQKPPAGSVPGPARPVPPAAPPAPPAKSISPGVKSGPEPEPGPDLKELEDIFKQSSPHLKPDEIDAYWDSLIEGDSTAPSSAGDLNYAQAADLGLAPFDPPAPDK